MDKLVGYAVVALLLAGAVWKLNDMAADHYQAPVKAQLEAAETSRDAWIAAAKDEKTKRDALNAQLLTIAQSDRTINAKLNKVANDLEQLRNQKPDVKLWADTPIPADVIRLRLEQTTPSPSTPGVQGGPSPETAGGQPSRANGRGDEPSDVEPDAGAGSGASEVQPTLNSDQLTEC